MKHQVVIRNPADIQWFGLNGDGALTFSTYHEDGMSLHGCLKANEAISTFSMVQHQGEVHILAHTVSGSLYYIRYKERSRDQQELRILSGHAIGFPYLFFYKSLLYVCCVVTDSEQSRLIIQSLASGMWTKKSLTLFSFEDAGIQLEDAIFAMSNDGKLHGLFRYLNQHDECVLSCLEYDIDHDIRVERRLFALKQKNQRWHLGLDVDSLGMPHFVWTILNGGTAAYYYVNAEREARSSMPLLINGEHEAAIPHFLFASEFILVMFWNGNGRVEYVYSFNRGKKWSASSYIHFGTRSPLRLVQSIRRQSRVITPEPVLGIHWPYFRPFEFMDLIHPQMGFEFSKSPMERLHWIKLQIKDLYSDYSQQMSQLRQETSDLLLLKEASEDQVRHLMQEVDQLKTEEQKVLLQLKTVYDFKEEEPFSLRFIR